MLRPDMLRFRKGDWLAIGLVAAMALVIGLCFLPRANAAAYAQVYQDGKLVRSLPLDADTVFVIEGNYCNEITVKDGAVAFTSSDCPGRDCVHSGSIHSAGRSLVCLPNKVEIRVIAEPDGVDFVVG